MSLQDDLHRLLPPAGFTLPEPTLTRLAGFGEWLIAEAAPAGGIGPAEVDRVVDRHVLDSLLFATAWQQLGHSPTTLLDLGSGVGLPGIPLAICFSSTPTVLVDRSGRRAQLARRAVRVLGLENVEIRQADFAQIPDANASTVVSRASLPPDLLLGHIERTRSPDGVGIVAASVRNRMEQPPFRSLEVHLEVLGVRRWFLTTGGHLDSQSTGGLQ